MPDNNTPFVRRLAILGALTVLLLVLLSVYGSRGSYIAATPVASFTPTITNPEILQNWLPATSYKYTIARINDYLTDNNLPASTITVQGDVSISQTKYQFTILLEPQNQTHDVTVTIANFGGIISTGTAIDGKQQGGTVPSQTTDPQTGATTAFSGFDNLITAGVTTFQADALQTAFKNFAPAATTISISTSTINSPVDTQSGIATYTFTVTVDHATYTAKVLCPSLNQTELFLSDSKTGKQVFDSGTLTQN